MEKKKNPKKILLPLIAREPVAEVPVGGGSPHQGVLCSQGSAGQGAAQ